MSTLANVQPTTDHIAVQNGLAGIFTGLINVFASFSQALAATRAFEDAFSRHGHVGPETVQRLQEQLQSR